MEIWEYESIANCKKCFSRLMQDEELMTQIFPEFASYFAPATHTIEVWSAES